MYRSTGGTQEIKLIGIVKGRVYYQSLTSRVSLDTCISIFFLTLPPNKEDVDLHSLVTV